MAVLPAALANAQVADTPKSDGQKTTPRPVTPRLPKPDLRGLTIPDLPQHLEPAATDFYDPKYKVGFHVPAGWNFEKKDGLLSNFGVETRSARAHSDVRGVAAINFNPWPPTTFAGAIFYYSVIPKAQAAQCAAQASSRSVKPMPDAIIGSVPFHHGRDQHGRVCTEARDEIFTAMRGNACIRFDLVVNTFCADTSGAMEITPSQLKDVDVRLGGILDSVQIDGK